MSSVTEKNEGRLRLRSKAETSNNNEEKENSAQKMHCESPNEDDSLADFKSPKSLLNPPKILYHKKPGPRCSKKKSSSNTKKSTTIDQPSIESSFFKAQSTSNTFICPLCLKIFDDLNAQSSHAKSCAAKNNISTRKLLAASELQKRQEAERLKLGLPVGPIQTQKKKSNNSKVRKLIPEGDPDVHLAMALSMSLREMEQLEEFDEAVALVAESNEQFLEMSNSQRRSTLQSFGFKTNKPVVEVPPIKSKRRKNNGPTVLQTRTQETRERILTERIAEILVGIEQSTQAKQSPVNNYPLKTMEKTEFRSKNLQKWYNPDQKLWNRSMASLEGPEYYVKNLASFIAPAEFMEKSEEESDEEKKQDGVGDLVPENAIVIHKQIVEKSGKSDSEESPQINSDNNDESASNQDLSDTNPKQQTETKNMDNFWITVRKNRGKKKDMEIDYQSDGEKNRKDEIYRIDQDLSDTNPKQQTETKNMDNFWITVRKNRGKKKDMEVDYQSDGEKNRKDDDKLHKHLSKPSRVDFSSSLAFDWSKMINSKRGSDVKIIVKNDCIIYAHSAVFWARCPNLFNDHKDFDEDKSCVNLQTFIWSNIDYCTGIWFMQFLYCGEIFICCLSKDNSNVDQLRLLAEKYNFKELFDYIKKMQEIICDCQKKVELSVIEEKTKELIEKEEEEEERNDITLADESDVEMEQLPESPQHASRSTFNSRVTLSPDLFDDSGAYEDELTSIHLAISEDAPEESSTIDNVSIESDKVTSHENSPEISENNPKKTKSNLTLFIEKVQRRNAKDILDSDTEEDTPLKKIERCRRNPFKVRNDDDSGSDDSYLCIKKSRKSKTNENIDHTDSDEKKKTAFSILEDKIRAGAGKSLEQHEQSCLNNDDLHEGLTDIESDDANVSMFSQYRRKVSSNSIADYREKAKKYVRESGVFSNTINDSAKSETTITEITNLDDLSDIEVESLTQNNQTSLINNQTEEESEGFERINDQDISKVRESPIDLTQLSVFELDQSVKTPRESNIINEDPPGIDMDDIIFIEQKDKTSPAHSQKSSKVNNPPNTVIHLNEDLQFDSWADATKFESPLTQSFREPVSEKIPPSLKDKENESSQINSDQNNEIEMFGGSFTQSLLLSPEARNRYRRNCTPSPIYLSSGSEKSFICNNEKVPDSPDHNDDISSKIRESNKENNFNETCVVEDHFDYNKINALFDSPLSFSSSGKEPQHRSTPSTSTNITFRTYKVLKKVNERSVHSISDNSEDENPADTNPVKNKLKRKTSIEKNSSSRYLAVNSKSDGNFSKFSNISIVESLSRADSNPVSFSHPKNSDLSRSSQDVAPYLDFERMSSPQLHVELKKYGLKKLKRSKAIYLLQQIYEELHPMVQYSPRVSSPDSVDKDEPPSKKPCFNNISHVSDEDSVDNSDESLLLSQESITSNLSMIPEEMDLDDQDLPSNTTDSLPIELLFKQLLKKDRELNNKVLTYMPLPLEDLYQRLKLEGFKGKLNDLMDYLDNECITFQVQDANKKKDRRKKKKKNSQRTKKNSDRG